MHAKEQRVSQRDRKTHRNRVEERQEDLATHRMSYSMVACMLSRAVLFPGIGLPVKDGVEGNQTLYVQLKPAI